MAGRLIALLAAVTLAGCLDVPELTVSGYFGCEIDGDCPSGWTCWERTDGSRRCFEQIECRAPDDAACDDGEVCTADACDMDRGACTHSPATGAVCAPGGCDAEAVYTPPSVCDRTGACVASEPVACDLGDTCASYSCDAQRGGCTAIPSLGLDCGVAGLWHGVFTRIKNNSSRDFRVFPLELELDTDLPATWRFETSPGVYGTTNAINLTALSSGEMLVSDLDTELWMNVTPTREVIAGWDFGSVGPVFFVRAPDTAPAADALAGHWQALLIAKRDDPDEVRSLMFETYGGRLTLADSGETACVEAGGATLEPAAAPADPTPWQVSDGACAAVDADGSFTLQHDVGAPDGGSRRERWRGWLTPSVDVAVAVREVDDGAGGFAKATGFVFLVRESEAMPASAMEGSYAVYRGEHNVITDGTLYCWGQTSVAATEVTGGEKVCNNTSENCEWRDRSTITDGTFTAEPSGAVSGRVFTGPVLNELIGQAAPISDAVHATPLVIGRRLGGTGEGGEPLARAGTWAIHVWQPPGVAPRLAPMYTWDDEEPWCPPVSN